MPLAPVQTNREKKAFIDLYYTVYKNIPANRDNLNHAARNFLYGRDAFARACRVEPLLAFEADKPTARAMLLYHPGLAAVQVGFFEALENQQPAVDAILERAKALAAELGLSRVILGLNGHLTYGLGFLADGWHRPACFDGVYTPAYYLDYFQGKGFAEHTLTTYRMDTRSFAPPEKALERAYEGLYYRHIDLGNLPREMEILGDLFNKTLEGTRFYAPRPHQESYEMIRGLKPLINNEHIIYALKDGREIGFVIWHPNFYQALSNNARQNELLFFLKCKLFAKRTTEYKINTIGVLPAYENSGAALGLINEVYKRVKGRFSGGETAFVWDGNLKSTLFCRATCVGECRHYVVYEWPLK